VGKISVRGRGWPGPGGAAGGGGGRGGGGGTPDVSQARIQAMHSA